LYWTDNSSINDIVCCNLDGTNVETIITNQGFIKGVTFDPDNQKIYWVEYTAGTIKRANLNGSDVETVLDNLDHPKGIIFFSLE
jgi:sugar lactone lactonase YvrE